MQGPIIDHLTDYLSNHLELQPEIIRKVLNQNTSLAIGQVFNIFNRKVFDFIIDQETGITSTINTLTGEVLDD